MRVPHIIGSVLIVACTACGGSSPPAIVGTWVGTVTHGQYFGASASLAFAPDGSYTGNYDTDDSVDVRGAYAVTGTQLSITDASGSFACGAVTGMYDFTVASGTLTLTLVNDPCTARAEILTTTHWGG
jgi:hypothetical protein